MTIIAQEVPYVFDSKQWFPTWARDQPTTRGVRTTFGGIASRYFMCTDVLHFLYSSFR